MSLTPKRAASDDVTDAEILAACRPYYQPAYLIVEILFGRQLKHRVPHIRARLNKLTKAGLVDAKHLGVRCCEIWRLK